MQLQLAKMQPELKKKQLQLAKKQLQLTNMQALLYNSKCNREEATAINKGAVATCKEAGGVDEKAVANV